MDWHRLAYTLIFSACCQSVIYALFFDQVLSGEAVPNNKPAPDIYVEISGKLGVEVGQCLVIEDSSNGIQAAKDAGMTTWAVDQAQYNVDQSRADRIVSGMDEIRKTLK
nr:HAD family hydrolase [Lacticaseibacillus pantheris]